MDAANLAEEITHLNTKLTQVQRISLTLWQERAGIYSTIFERVVEDKNLLHEKMLPRRLFHRSDLAKACADQIARLKILNARELSVVRIIEQHAAATLGLKDRLLLAAEPGLERERAERTAQLLNEYFTHYARLLRAFLAEESAFVRKPRMTSLENAYCAMLHVLDAAERLFSHNALEETFVTDARAVTQQLERFEAQLLVQESSSAPEGRPFLNTLRKELRVLRGRLSEMYATGNMGSEDRTIRIAALIGQAPLIAASLGVRSQMSAAVKQAWEWSSGHPFQGSFAGFFAISIFCLWCDLVPGISCEIVKQTRLSIANLRDNPLQFSCNQTRFA